MPLSSCSRPTQIIAVLLLVTLVACGTPATTPTAVEQPAAAAASVSAVNTAVSQPPST